MVRTRCNRIGKNNLMKIIFSFFPKVLHLYFQLKSFTYATSRQVKYEIFKIKFFDFPHFSHPLSLLYVGTYLLIWKRFYGEHVYFSTIFVKNILNSKKYIDVKRIFIRQHVSGVCLTQTNWSIFFIIILGIFWKYYRMIK